MIKTTHADVLLVSCIAFFTETKVLKELKQVCSLDSAWRGTLRRLK